MSQSQETSRAQIQEWLEGVSLTQQFTVLLADITAWLIIF